MSASLARAAQSAPPQFIDYRPRWSVAATKPRHASWCWSQPPAIAGSCNCALNRAYPFLKREADGGA